MKKIFLVLAFLIPLIACARAPIKDPEIPAIKGKDFTALIEGCGNQLQAGLLNCRRYEGSSAEEMLYFVGPVTNCKREFCVEFKIYHADGNLAYGDAIPKKQFRKGVPWSKILKRPSFELGDRGFWFFTYNVFWVNSDGHEEESKSEGEIRLRVLKKDYIPLHEVVNDGAFTWDFSTRNGERVKITTGMRTYVSSRTALDVE